LIQWPDLSACCGFDKRNNVATLKASFHSLPVPNKDTVHGESGDTGQLIENIRIFWESISSQAYGVRDSSRTGKFNSSSTKFTRHVVRQFNDDTHDQDSSRA